MSDDPVLQSAIERIADAMAEAAVTRDPPMLFRLRKDAATYLSFGSGATLYCYTPHPDTNGDFWAFDWVTKNGTSVMKRKVRCASRFTAKVKARTRYNKAKGK